MNRFEGRKKEQRKEERKSDVLDLGKTYSNRLNSIAISFDLDEIGKKGRKSN